MRRCRLFCVAASRYHWKQLAAIFFCTQVAIAGSDLRARHQCPCAKFFCRKSLPPVATCGKFFCTQVATSCSDLRQLSGSKIRPFNGYFLLLLFILLHLHPFHFHLISSSFLLHSSLHFSYFFFFFNHHPTITFLHFDSPRG